MNIQFPRFLTGAYLESLNQQIFNEIPVSVTIQVKSLERSRLFASSRLMALLLKCRQKNISIIIQAPQDLNSLSEGNKKLFFNSAAGFILTYFADSILSPSGIDFRDDIIRIQYEPLFNNNGIISSGNEKTALFINGFNKPKRSEVFSVPIDSKSNFESGLSKFYSSFSRLLCELGNFENPALVQEVSTNFGFEAIQNVNEHALRDIDDKSIDQLQFLYLKRININNYSTYFDNLIESSVGGPFSNYLNLLKSKLGFDLNVSSEKFLIEITIADCGIGIPAKLKGDMSIYTGNIDHEKSLLLMALEQGSSSKKQVTSEYGLGLPKIMNVTKRINGFIAFRTGRLFMYRHFLDESYKNDKSNLTVWDSDEKCYLPGTAISIFFPWTDINLNQTRLFG